MRIGIYGLPTSGKSFVLEAVSNYEVLAGSALLLKIAPNFFELSPVRKNIVRKQLASMLRERDNFIMDGHYSFGNDIVFTEEDGILYDVILYLYVDPNILTRRMKNSERNSKYLRFDLAEWQQFEINSLRQYCHLHNKDFYVIDNPQNGYFQDINIILQFIDSISAGYSCVAFAKKSVDEIITKINSVNLCLADGDKTISVEDSSGSMGYKTHTFDGNFYTGFQSWRHNREFYDYLTKFDNNSGNFEESEVHINDKVVQRIKYPCIIVTSGYYDIWKKIAEKLNMLLFSGDQMSADTKYFITKFLQQNGKCITAYGDGMNDYYMLKQADYGYVVAKTNGSLSQSLKGKNMEGLMIV